MSSKPTVADIVNALNTEPGLLLEALNQLMGTVPDRFAVTEDMLKLAVVKYLTDHKADFKGTDGISPKVDEIVKVLKADANFVASLKGTPGANVTDDMVKAVVAKYLTDHKADFKGTDGISPKLTDVVASMKADAAFVDALIAALAAKLVIDTKFIGRIASSVTVSPTDVDAAVQRIIAANPAQFKGEKGDRADAQAVANALAVDQTFQQKVKGDPGDDGEKSSNRPGILGCILGGLALIVVLAMFIFGGHTTKPVAPTAITPVTATTTTTPSPVLTSIPAPVLTLPVTTLPNCATLVQDFKARNVGLVSDSELDRIGAMRFVPGTVCQ